MSETQVLAAFLKRLASDGPQPLADYPFLDAPPQLLGLQVRDARVSLPAGLSLLDAAAMQAHLRPCACDWLQCLEVHYAIGSTNVRLADLGESAAGVAVLAELQTSGRGRRGRKWFSPFAGSLSLSMGFAFPGGPAALSGLSLAVGLGVATALEESGVPDVNLKWPNDVRVGEAKICGILIELVTVPSGVIAVVGIGVNVRAPDSVRAQVDQVLTDVTEHGAETDRNVLAAGVMNAVVEVVEQFRKEGFAPLRAAYDACHGLQGLGCSVIGASGEIHGTVEGVSDSGQLIVRTAEGRVHFDGGEVSLRGAPGA